jgi:hypothetical protein
MNTPEPPPTAAESETERLAILRGIHQQLRRLTFWVVTLTVIVSLLGAYFICASNGYGELALVILAIAGSLLLVFTILGGLYRHQLERDHLVRSAFGAPE